MNRPATVVAAAASLAAAVFVFGAPLANADPQGAPAAAAPAAEPPAAPAPDGPRAYTLDTGRTLLVLQVFKAGAAAAFAHDHVISPKEFSGDISVDPQDPGTLKVNVVVQTASLINDDPKLCKVYKIESEISDKDRKTVEESMKGPDQLDVKKYPTITFRSKSAKKDGEGKAKVTGDFTLHGVTKEITLPFDYKVEDKGGVNVVTGHAVYKFKTSEYGIEPYSAFLGAVKNKDDVILNLHLVGRTP